ncbi:hypothetical protein [Actinoplanes sp. NPDC049316]|uniref:hypothetical protein n=1 Tax=Actinoplanes sp. NPDC049316 TaxID=3154727 RepID=UPI00342ACADF
MVLRPGTDESDVRALADRLGFTVVREMTADPVQGVQREVTWRVDEGLVLHYAEEAVSGCVFVQVQGDADEDVAEVADAVASYLVPVSLEDALVGTRVPADEETRAARIVQAGLSAPEHFDDRFLRVFAAAMRDGSRRIREAGVWATTYSNWPEAKPLLQAVMANDPDPGLRADAQNILEVAHGGTGR